MPLKTRDAVLLYQETQGDTDTRTLDINIPDPISAFEIEVESTNGATSNLGNFISDIVTKIELVDGSNVLCSLNMSQLEALHFYKTGKTPALFPSEWGGGVQRHNAMLLFGRYLWDPQYAFQPALYRNPQLKLTFNKAAITAAGATGFASGDNIKLTVVAKVAETGLTPIGYLMQKEIDSFTSAASGDKRIEMPIDYPYRAIMLRAWLQSYDIDEIISNLKLTFDTDKYIPLDRKVSQLDAASFAQYGAGRLKHDIYTSDDDDVRLLFNKEPDVRIAWTDQNLFDIIGIGYQWSSQLHLWLGTHAGAADGTSRKLTMVEEGHALHATLYIPFGRSMDADTWLDISGFTKLEAVLTQATASATVQIVAEQVRV